MIDYIELLKFIDPAALSYQEWVNVGMALHHEGVSVDVWEQWSASDVGRYHAGECYTKWNSFNGSASPVTGGTLVQLAKQGGWRPHEDRELEWDDIIQDDYVIVDQNWIEKRELKAPRKWDPVKQLITYLETLYDSDENVGYVTRSTKGDNGKYNPTKGCYDRTAGQLIEQLSKCDGDIGKVLGDYNPEVGAWIRFNPLDGKGVKNDNVADYRYALVESDSVDIETQNAIVRELELPIACLVHSGNKSLHAIVKVEAQNYEEYRKRVDYLYNICQKNGLEMDTQNRNPSRLSRMPGVTRAGQKQYLIDTNIGKSSWSEWVEWIEDLNDDLPDIMTEREDNDLPPLSPSLVDGVLRQGHKMLIVGPSKAGKSFALIELAICIAEGKQWLGFSCAQGKVLYVNLELDDASCEHRFHDVRCALNIPKRHKVDIWNLRGHSLPMDKLAPKLIRRAAKKNYIAIIIDPIYKVITGDENSADQMAKFCNQFDKVCTELGCAVIYCHHHSKGAQGGKRSMDRASGSGVFARDPDAILDLLELEVPESVIKQEENRRTCTVCLQWLERFDKTAADDLSPDDKLSAAEMLGICRKTLSAASFDLMLSDINKAKKTAGARTAWRIEGTLREYPKFAPVNMWFDYPIHVLDDNNILNDVQANGNEFQQFKRSKKESGRPSKIECFRTTFANLSSFSGSDSVKVTELAESMNVSPETIKNYIKQLPDEFERDNGFVTRVQKSTNN
ncbi:MAG: AAA family ATPase [Clostridia bacterium]|nr:AAA family ATPase [Clostridia bacterium]